MDYNQLAAYQVNQLKSLMEALAGVLLLVEAYLLKLETCEHNDLHVP